MKMAGSSWSTLFVVKWPDEITVSAPYGPSRLGALKQPGLGGSRRIRSRHGYLIRLFVFRQPCQSFLAGLKSGKLAAGEATQVLRERMRKVLCSHPRGFLDMRLVKHGA